MEGLKQDTVQRLALIRVLYDRALEASNQPEPVGALSLLSFHDSVELMLQLVWEHLNITDKPPRDLDGYWEPINRALPVGSQLGGRMEMRQLNRARVGLKHGGIVPARSSIEGHRAATTSFLESVTPIVFDGVQFDNVDMIQLVTFDKTRALLDRSSDLASNGDFEAALGHIAIAFYHLRRDARERLRWRAFAGRPYVSVPSVSDDDLSDALRDFAAEVEDHVDRLEDAIEIVALGLDLRRWERFVAWTPWVVTYPDEDAPRYREKKWPAGNKRGAKEVEYCRSFVIDSALRLQQLEP